jgi:adenylosuccinate lyase
MNSLSPLDGRYADQLCELKDLMNEKSFFKYRLVVELKYFLKLIDYLPELNKLKENKIKYKFNFLYYINNFDDNEYNIIKSYEKTTNHDVKALEYYIQDIFEKEDLKEYIPFIHFGLTSQDINSSANIMMFKESINNILIDSLHCILNTINNHYRDMKDISMLSFTHGQCAVPTTMGKELYVYKYRLEKQINILQNMEYSTKFGGAVGNFNAHKLAYPNIDWNDFSDNFIEKDLLLKREKYTTQISNYDNLCNTLNMVKTINCIINDLNIDCWLYISKGYLNQKINSTETGSSTMPHKVNPINFENSEGNICIANALIEGITRKLSISRLQRDLTDSTILRNLGTVLGYSLLSYKSTLKGLNKISLNKKIIKNDLTNNVSILAEGIQTVMRKHKISNSYEKLKDLTRINDNVNENDINEFIKSLDENIQKELLLLNVENYIGYSKK